MDAGQVIGQRRPRASFLRINGEHRRKTLVRVEGIGRDVPVEDADHPRRIERIG